MQTREEVMGAVYNKTDIQLWPYDGPHTQTSCLAIDKGPIRSYSCDLWGPFADSALTNPLDLRIFVVVRKLDGETTLQLLCQDSDDDVFLNSTAEGAEKYNIGTVNVGG